MDAMVEDRFSETLDSRHRFAHEVLKAIPDRPVSFEVFADDFPTMESQALEIASWGRNVNVKIPVTNTRGEFSGALIERLSKAGVQLNVTALLTLEQVKAVTERLAAETPASCAAVLFHPTPAHPFCRQGRNSRTTVWDPGERVPAASR